MSYCDAVIGSFKFCEWVCVSANLQAFPIECAYCVWISLHTCVCVWACAFMSLFFLCFGVCVCVFCSDWCILMNPIFNSYTYSHLQLMLRLKSRVAYRLVLSLYFPRISFFSVLCLFFMQYVKWYFWGKLLYLHFLRPLKKPSIYVFWSIGSWGILHAFSSV